MNKLITKNIEKLNHLFQSHKIEKAYVFGSAAFEKLSAKSDIDLLVSFKNDVKPVERGELWWSLYENLKTIFNREVDIITEGSLKNPYFIEEVNNTKQLIYG